jgi:hypothetical protein
MDSGHGHTVRSAAGFKKRSARNEAGRFAGADDWRGRLDLRSDAGARRRADRAGGVSKRPT